MLRASAIIADRSQVVHQLETMAIDREADLRAAPVANVDGAGLGNRGVPALEGDRVSYLIEPLLAGVDAEIERCPHRSSRAVDWRRRVCGDGQSG